MATVGSIGHDGEDGTVTSGCRLAQYELLNLLGRGGMGSVYQAYDTRLQRYVAVKVLRPAPEGHARSRVWREARAAAKVNHPAICQTYDVGEVGSTLFLVMELLTGESLATRLKRGALPFDDAIDVALGMLAGVHALHGRQIVHAISSHRTCISPTRGSKLLDFGLARPGQGGTASDLTITASGTVIGTPRYMAPEQWSGTEPDPRSDLFAVGLLLFEMLTGTPPCRGDNINQIYHSVMTAQPFVKFDCALPAQDDAGRHAIESVDDLAADLRRRFREALRGTLFVDRIETMTQGGQAFLMSMLAAKSRHEDAPLLTPRIITGSNGSLLTAVAAGSFNEALLPAECDPPRFH